MTNLNDILNIFNFKFLFVQSNFEFDIFKTIIF